MTRTPQRRRKIKMKSIIFILIFLIVSCASSAQTKNTNAEELISKWEKSDGEQVGQISFLLVKSFILNDTAFLKLMMKHKDAYNKWVTGMPGDLFTIYDYSDSVDIVLQSSYITKLKTLMIECANKFKNDHRFGPLANLLLNKLKYIKIKLVD